LVFNPRLVASTQDSQSQTARTLSRFKAPLWSSTLSSSIRTLSSCPYHLGTYLLYCVANWYHATHMIIASGGQPTKQSQSSPNQSTHVVSLSPLDLNIQAHHRDHLVPHPHLPIPQLLWQETSQLPSSWEVPLIPMIGTQQRPRPFGTPWPTIIQ